MGSVALYYIACLINRTASSTSFIETSVARRILAIDSDIRTIDSSYRGVAVIVFLEFPIFLIAVYSLIRASEALSESKGCELYLAKQLINIFN